MQRVRAMAVWCVGVGLVSGVVAGAQTQAGIPVVALPDAAAKSAESFGVIANVRELPGGKVLVDDVARRQVQLLSADLTIEGTVKDSTRGAANYYGPRVMPLIPFVADSTAFPNLPNRSLTIIDPAGKPIREAVMPVVIDVAYLRRAYTDPKGRVVFAGEPAVLKAEIAKQPVVADTAPLIREDLATRKVDTVAYIMRPLIAANATGAAGAVGAYFNPDPLKTIDEWTMTSDGTIAIVRGHDYKVDFIRMDGTRSSSPKLPFDWRALSEADKVKMIDSAETLRKIAARNNTLVNGIEKLVMWAGTQRNGPAAKGTSLAPKLDTTGALISKNNGGGDMTVFANPRRSIDEVFDYYPPIRAGSVFADYEANVWTLPTTSKQSKAGELVYDVISPKGELTRRVRAPLGRYIVGFGRNGAVYLATGSSARGFTLERTTVPR